MSVKLRVLGLCTSAIESHASGASEVVLPNAALLDNLLSQGITGCEEHLASEVES
jgi:hypothetical protein